MQLIYNVKDKPSLGKIITFAFQQMIAIMAATLLVPIVVSMTGLTMDPAAALFGAGIGTVVYILITKGESPVFLGSSFTFLGALSAAATQNYGYWGLIIGVCFAGLVYVIIALIIKLIGSGWVNKLLPPVIIGPILTLIGLSLSSTATSWMMANGGSDYNMVSIFIGLFTFLAIVVTSIKGGKNLKLIPFIVGIGAGYALALVVTLIGMATGVASMQVLSFDGFVSTFGNFTFESILKVPDFTFMLAIQTAGQYPIDGTAVANLALLFMPIGIVELAQHIADHKNISNIIEKDLIKNPGLDKTLLGDGIGSMVGSVFGGCANTTYGESIGCVALTKNASTITILAAGIGCMVLSFFTPFVVIINSIPKCVMGGACIAMYGFIAVSGLQMLRNVDLGDNRNLYVVASILVCGIGGLTFEFGYNEIAGTSMFTLTALASALIIGSIVNAITHSGDDKSTGADIASAQVDISKEAFGGDTTTSKYNG
ncbi:MAG: solute carrier family 23 protein [Bacillota bacterium]